MIINKLLVLFFCFLFLFSCNKNEKKVSDLDFLRNSTNSSSYPTGKMDSAQVIHSIIKQKVQQLLELSTLYYTGNRNTEIDTTILSQMNSYFQTSDSLTFKPLFEEFDSLGVHSVKVKDLKIYKNISQNDTIDIADFDIEYFDDKNKSLGTYNRTARYALVSNPVQFKKEFKFYFVDFFSSPLPKPMTLDGVTK